MYVYIYIYAYNKKVHIRPVYRFSSNTTLERAPDV